MSIPFQSTNPAGGPQGIDALDFYRAAYADVLDQSDGRLLVWTLPEKLSSYHASAEDAFGEATRAENRGRNVYIGLGLCPPGLGSRERATTQQIVAIPGLAADLDRAKPGNKKQYPPDNEAILAILREAGDLKPTAIIESGGGLQAWWLFKEPWVFETESERDAAATLSRRWSHTLRAAAAKKGFALDGVGDLPRVLRAPGTVNQKYDPAREVRVVDLHDGRRYSPENFETYLVEAGVAADAGAHEPIDVDLSSPGGRPQEVEKLIEADDKFKRTWEGRRRNLEDTSASGHDLAIANRGAYHGWSDQVIADAIAARRRELGQQPDKGRRLDYLERTIAEARRWAAQRQQSQNEQLEVKAEAKPEQRNTTDLGNAERLADQHADRFRFCVSWGCWLVWDGKRWARDERGEIGVAAKQTVRGIYREAADESEPRRKKDLAAWAMKSEHQPRVAAMLKLAEKEPAFVVTAAELDADPWTLNVDNGLLDLRSGKMLSHDPAQLVSKIAATRYDSDATCPTWQAFLDRSTAGDPDLQRYLQRLVGLCLTGDITEQVFPVIYGPGGNGKSVFADFVHWLLGEYATVAPDSLVTVNAGQEHPTEIADLAGRRLVVATETEEGKRLRVALIKKMTGDATLKGRKMRQDFFEFRRTHKTWLITNHRPAIRESKNAVWRRLHLIPFTVVIPRAEQDRNLLGKLRDEAPGVLAWAVRGCLDWQRDGLEPPRAITSATRQYRRDSDPLADFIRDCCVVDGEHETFVTRKEIAAKYLAWCEEVGEDHKLPKTALYERLGDHPKVTPVNGRFGGKAQRGFRGITINSGAGRRQAA